MFKRFLVTALYFLTVPFVVGTFYFYETASRQEVSAAVNGELPLEVVEDKLAEVEQARLGEWMDQRSGAVIDWLMRQQAEDETLAINYDVRDGSALTAEDHVHNVVALRSLVLAYQQTPDAALLEAVDRGLEDYEPNWQTSEVDGKTVGYYETSNSVQANISALILSVRIERAAATGEPDPKLAQLADYLTLAQLPGGNFDNYYLNQHSISCTTSPFVDGILLAALAQAASTQDNPDWQAAAVKAADYAVDNYAGTIVRDFFIYGLRGVAQVYEMTGESRYLEFLVDQARMILRPDYQALTYFFDGSLKRPPIELPGRYNDGLLAVYGVLGDGQTELKQEIAAALVRSLALIGTFETPDAALLGYAPAPAAIGGICLTTQCQKLQTDAAANFLASLQRVRATWPEGELEQAIADLL